MRISDWSSDVCSSDLAARLHFVWDPTDALSVGLILNAGEIAQHGEGSQLIRARDRPLAAMHVFDPRTSAHPSYGRSAKDRKGRAARATHNAKATADRPARRPVGTEGAPPCTFGGSAYPSITQ